MYIIMLLVFYYVVSYICVYGEYKVYDSISMCMFIYMLISLYSCYIICMYVYIVSICVTDRYVQRPGSRREYERVGRV